MGKLAFKAIALLAALGTLVGIGALIGGELGANEAGYDAIELVSSCIDAHGGTVSKEQLAGCIRDEGGVGR